MSAVSWLVAAAATSAAVAFAAADGAVLAIEPDADSGAPRGVPGIRDRERAHRALAFARILAYLAAGAAIADGLLLTLDSRGGLVAAGLALALAVVALGEGAGRSLGFALRAALLNRLAPLVRVAEWFLALPLAAGEVLDRRLREWLPPAASAEEDRETSSERFRQIVAAEAAVTTHERDLLHGAFSLGRTEVREVMVPRVDMIAADLDMPWSEVLDRVRSSEHARLPVYRDTLDHVVGILYAKDLLPAVIAGAPPADGWHSLVRPASFIPPSRPIDDQLRDFQASRTQMAIVIDEFGGTAGLVTIEDILEEIVGEIRDEHDIEDADVEHEHGRRFWVAGRVTLDDLSSLVGREFELEGVTTVGGLVYTILGRVPRAGEELIYGGFRVVVERVRRRRVERVYFERLQPAAKEASQK
ncbi:MAG: hemolysin family protein [Gemmatimonadaceae bacterium]